MVGKRRAMNSNSPLATNEPARRIPGVTVESPLQPPPWIGRVSCHDTHAPRSTTLGSQRVKDRICFVSHETVRLETAPRTSPATIQRNRLPPRVIELLKNRGSGTSDC